MDDTQLSRNPRFELSRAPRPLDLPEGSVYDAWHLDVLSARHFEALNESDECLGLEQRLYLAAFALLAPTSHNTVPQRLQLDPKSGDIAVWLDRQFVLPQSDANGRQATISCGCATAHLCIAAGAYGLDSEVTQVATERSMTRAIVGSAERYSELVRVSFRPHGGPASTPEMLKAMVDRKVVRAEFDPRVGLEAAQVDALQQIVVKFPALRLHLLTDATSLMVLGKFQELADTTVFNREPFARELGQWLLANDDPSPLGMRGIEFGLNDESALRFHRGLCGLDRLLPDEVAGFAKAANPAMRSASAVAVITAEQDSVACWIDAGRAYAEIALFLQVRGYVTAMHAAITEVDAPNMALRGRLRTRSRPVVVFRIGKPLKAVDGNRPHSARPSLMQVVLP
jgi:hypothetical protein